MTSSANILARILINGKIITDTPSTYALLIASSFSAMLDNSRPLTGDFEGNIGQIFPCYVARTPDTIKVEFYDSSTRFRSHLAELYLPVPESTVTSENYQLQSFEFSSNVLRQFNANQTSAVGAGIPTPIQFDDLERIYLNIEGILTAGIAWGSQDGVALVPPDYATSKAFQRYSHRSLTTDRLTSVFQPTAGRRHSARHQHASCELEQPEDSHRLDQTIEPRSLRSRQCLSHQSDEGRDEASRWTQVPMVASRTTWAREVTATST